MSNLKKCLTFNYFFNSLYLSGLAVQYATIITISYVCLYLPLSYTKTNEPFNLNRFGITVDNVKSDLVTHTPDTILHNYCVKCGADSSYKTTSITVIGGLYLLSICSNFPTNILVRSKSVDICPQSTYLLNVFSYSLIWRRLNSWNSA